MIGRRTHRSERCVLLAERTQGILNPAIHCIQRVGDKVDAEGRRGKRCVCAKTMREWEGRGGGVVSVCVEHTIDARFFSNHRT